MGMGSWRCTDAIESTKKITLVPQKDAASEGVTVREVLKVDTMAPTFRNILIFPPLELHPYHR